MPYLLRKVRRNLCISPLVLLRVLTNICKIKLYRTYFKRFGFHFSNDQFYASIDRKYRNNFIEHIRGRTTPQFFMDTHRKDKLMNAIKSEYPESIQWTITAADEICNHVFDLLGSGKVELGKEIDWHRDFKSALAWKPFFYADILEVNRNDHSDIKIPWELCRFYHFVTLGKAYWFTGNEKYAEEFVNQLEDWLKNNPPFYGIHWVSILNVGIRMVNWIWAYHFFKDSPAFKKDIQIRFFKSLIFHGNHIVNNFQYGAHADNHFLGNITGLIYFGLMFPEFKQSKRWLNLGLRELVFQIEKQIYPDGVDYEMSVGYHRFVLELLLSPILLCRSNGIEMPPFVMNRLEKMFEFVMYYTKPDGTVPVIGDADDGRLHKLSTKIMQDNIKLGNHLRPIKVSLEHIDHRYLLSIGAVLFNRTDFKRTAGQFHEEAFWLLGEDGLNRFAAIPTKENGLESKAFHNGGFYVMRKDSLYLMADCGYIGKGKYSDIGHGHNDTLSFELFAYDKTFITDCGSYVYSADVHTRNEFRMTKSHNTVVVDDEEIAEIDGIWMIRDNTHPKVHAWKATDISDFWDAEHDGYKRLPSPVIHRRRIYFNKQDGYWIIKDILSGKGMHKFDWYFHFDIGIEVELEDDKTVKTRCEEGANLLLIPLEIGDISVEILDGWVSKSYGVKRGAKVVRFTKNAETPVVWSVLIYPYLELYQDVANKVSRIVSEKAFCV